MKRNTLLIAGAAVLTTAAIGAGGVALANAGNASTTASQRERHQQPGAATEKNGQGRPGGAVKQGEGLSGDTAVKAVQAAVAKEPTAVLLRAVKASDGTYRVAMRRTDGTRITLTLDANFAVTATQEHAAKPQRTSKPTTTGTASHTS